MYIILLIIMLFIFNNMTQIRNRKLLGLSCGDVCVKGSFKELMENIFVNVNKNPLENFTCKEENKDLTLDRDDNISRIGRCDYNYLVFHDQLTGLYNRKFFRQKLVRLDIQGQFPLAVIVGDINGLKFVNDSLGYLEGDKLLKRTAEIIKKGCGKEHIIARIGGDEFVILLPNTNENGVKEIIKNIKCMALREKTDFVNMDITFGYAIKNHKREEIQGILKKAEDNMYKNKVYENLSVRSNAVNIIVNALYEKNKREEMHSRRVSQLCMGMGKALGLSEDEIKELKSAGLLHDIGKIAIDESILNKKEKLTESEWNKMKEHPEIGFRVLSSVNDMSEISEYVLSHHERWDGSGYPKSLKQKEIPFQSRIITIADAYDAMISRRSYGSVLSEQQAMRELQKNAYIQFDPELIEVFIEKVLNRCFLFK